MTGATALAAVQRAYAAVSTDDRVLRAADRVPQDWPLDSLSTEEMLIRLEDELGIRLVGDERVAEVGSVAELCALIDTLTADR